MNNFKVLSVFSILGMLPIFGIVYADEPITTTISHTFDDVKWDGAWSFTQEWKASSYDKIKFGDDQLVIRTAHQDGYLYFMLNVLYDFTNDRMADRAIVCLDGGNITERTDNSDWCYTATRGSQNGHTLNGGSVIARTGHFHLTENHPEFIGIGGTSSTHDRYLKTPHAAYEFRIPIEQIGFADKYGLFIQVFDGNDVKSYPAEHSGKYPQKIPSPVHWGLIVSPDGSITSEHFNQN